MPKKQGDTPESRLMHLTAFLLEQRGPVTFEAICEAFPAFYQGGFAARDRKWTRDKNELLRAGVPIRFIQGVDDEPGYVLEPRAYFLEKLALEPVEAALLATAAAAALQLRDNPARADLLSAMRTIAAALRPGQPASLPFTAKPHHSDKDKVRPRRVSALLEQVRRAIHERRRLRMRYLNARLEESEREVDLYGYAWRRGAWLVVGYCHAKSDVRVFYVDRIRALVPAHSRRGGADYEIPEDFDIKVHSRQQPWQYYSHPALEATLRLRGALADIASSTFPGATTQHVDADGAVTLLLRTTDVAALVRHALHLGPDCELIAPESARRLAREMLGKLAPATVPAAPAPAPAAARVTG